MVVQEFPQILAETQAGSRYGYVQENYRGPISKFPTNSN